MGINIKVAKELCFNLCSVLRFCAYISDLGKGCMELLYGIFQEQEQDLTLMSFQQFQSFQR